VALVPKGAVRTEGGQSYAFVVTGEGLIDRRAVKAGGTDGDRVEVRAGLKPGDRVVVAGPADLKDGAKVRVK
jgi:multidrug efflux pump subunit AcrA (membrane-fusion protein)